LARLRIHLNRHIRQADEGATEIEKPSTQLAAITEQWTDETRIEGEHATALSTWLDHIRQYVDEANPTEERRYDRLHAAVQVADRRAAVLRTLNQRLPVFVLFNNYFRVR
jgi:hypothetical protein